MAEKQIDNGGQAFPRAGYDGPDNHDSGKDGMTLRDYFAAKALAMMDLPHDGRYSKIDRDHGHPQIECQWRAVAAYRMADAMLAARRAQ